MRDVLLTPWPCLHQARWPAFTRLAKGDLFWKSRLISLVSYPWPWPVSPVLKVSGVTTPIDINMIWLTRYFALDVVISALVDSIPEWLYIVSSICRCRWSVADYSRGTQQTWQSVHVPQPRRRLHHRYSGTPLVRPPLFHQKSGL